MEAFSVCVRLLAVFALLVAVAPSRAFAQMLLGRATFGQVKDANGNYLRNSVLRGAPLQAQFGLRIQF